MKFYIEILLLISGALVAVSGHVPLAALLISIWALIKILNKPRITGQSILGWIFVLVVIGIFLISILIFVNKTLGGG